MVRRLRKGGRAAALADATAADLYAAIDLLADKLDRMAVKLKEKMKDHHRGESAAKQEKFG